MTDNKRAADDALPAAWVEAILAYGDARADKNLAEGIASLKKAIKLIRAALSGCADGGKGEAVAVAFIEGDDVQRVLRWNKDVAAFNYEIGTSLYTAPQAECAPIAPRADADTAGAHIASIYADADGTKHVQLDVEDIDDIQVGTKLYLSAPTLTMAEIEEIAGYAENEGKACGISSLYIAAETAIEETLRRLAATPASNERADANPDAVLRAYRQGVEDATAFPYQKTFDAIAAATSISCGTIAISVIKFREVFGLLDKSADERADAENDAALTDEEIAKIALEHGLANYMSKVAAIKFARAILAAKEKKS